MGVTTKQCRLFKAWAGFVLQAVVNTEGGLLASRRVFCWLPLFYFVPIRQINSN